MTDQSENVVRGKFRVVEPDAAPLPEHPNKAYMLELIEDWKQKIEANDVVGIAYAMFHSDGDISHGWSVGGIESSDIVAGVNRLHFDAMQHDHSHS